MLGSASCRKPTGARVPDGSVTLGNGKVLRVKWFAERAEALDAVGLRE
jgi:hypothetical protein